MFIELTRKSGTKIVVNVRNIVYAMPSDSGTTLYVAGEYILVSEDYDTVTRRAQIAKV